MNTHNAKTQDVRSELLSRLARQTLQPAFLGSVNGSDIYQVTQGWQREVLLDEPGLVIARNGTELEDAVQKPEIHTVFIPSDAALTQEVTERILQRNALSQTIFWEV